MSRNNATVWVLAIFAVILIAALESYNIERMAAEDWKLMDDLRRSGVADWPTLEARSQSSAGQLRLARFTNLAGAGFALGIVLVAAATVNAETKRRHRVNDALALAKSQAESALTRLDAFFAHTPYGVAYLDDHLRFLRVNDAFAEANGLPVEKHIGMRLPDLDAQFPIDLIEDYRAVLSTRKPLINRTVEGPSNTWELNAFPVSLPGGPVTLGLIGVDVTQRAVAERRLRESEASFRSLTEAMPQIVWAAGGDGAIEYFNSEWFDYTGVPAAESLGFRWLESIHAEDRERSRILWANNVALGKPHEIEYRLRRRDGAYRWFLKRARPLAAESGSPLRWLGTCTDIDDSRRLAETLEQTVQERTAALRDQRTFLDAILNNVNEGIVACDASGKLLFNRATREMHGLPLEPLPLWRTHESLFEGDGVTPLAEDRLPLRRAMDGEILHDVEMVVHPGSGRERYLLCSGQPLINAAGNTFGAVVSMRDMTQHRTYALRQLAHEADLEHKVAERTAELKTANRALIESDHNKDEFLATLAHELRNPLAPIRNALELQKLMADDPVATGEAREVMERQLAQMVRLIDDLLDAARLSRGKLSLSLEPLDLRSVLEMAVETSQHSLEKAGLILRLEIPAEPLPYRGDRVRLTQIFANILNNCAKYTDRGGQVLLGVEKRDSDYRIHFHDDGMGIPAEHLAGIFELFAQVDRTPQSTPDAGLGIGLALVKRLVEMHRGTVLAESPGLLGGTTIAIALPHSRNETGY